MNLIVLASMMLSIDLKDRISSFNYSRLYTYHFRYIMRHGTIKVNVIEATLKKDQDTFGKMDPFVRIQVGKTVLQTNIQEGAGLNPKWNQVLQFQINDGQVFLQIEVRQDDGGSSDLCGVGSFDFGPIMSTPNDFQPVKIYLTNQDQDAGILQTEVSFIPIEPKTLYIKVNSAAIKEDSDLFGKMDPFVEIKVNTITKRTTIKQDVGTQPIWEQDFEFSVVSENPKIIFSVRDDDGKEGAKYDECGVVETCLDELKEKDDTVAMPMMLKGDEAGTLSFNWALKG